MQTLSQWQIQLLLQIVLRDSKGMPNGTMLGFLCACFSLASNIAAGFLDVVVESDLLLHSHVTLMWHQFLFFSLTPPMKWQENVPAPGLEARIS